MGQAQSATASATTPSPTANASVPLDASATHQAPVVRRRPSTIRRSTPFPPEPRAKPVATHKCRLLSHQTPVELTSTDVQTAHGQKYVYFALPKSTTLHDYPSVVCTSVGGEVPVGNAFALCELACSGTKRNADGAYMEYTCGTGESNVQPAAVNAAKAGQLMARVKVKDGEAEGEGRLGTPQTGWVLVWTYRVG